MLLRSSSISVLSPSSKWSFLKIFAGMTVPLLLPIFRIFDFILFHRVIAMLQQQRLITDCLMSKMLTDN